MDVSGPGKGQPDDGLDVRDLAAAHSVGPGQGMPNRLVFITSTNGNFSTRTNSFGSYSFDNIQIGTSITVGVSSKAFTYADQIVTVGGQITNIDFTPQVSFK